jgi:peptidoglycan L-alanyl-D-glutamate endopeptidase CwlK
MGFQLTAADRKLLKGVHADLVKVIVRAAEITDVPFRITEGLRTIQRQRQLVEEGKSKTLNSRHLTGHAVDLVPLVDLNHNDRYEANELYHWPSFYRLAPFIKRAAKDVGVPVEWGGDWRDFKDGPHWQLPRRVYPGKLKSNFFNGLFPDMPCEAYDELTETEDVNHYKNAGAVTAAGALGVGTTITPVIADLVQTLTMQQMEITSGDIVRIVMAASIIALSVYVVWRSWRSVKANTATPAMLPGEE